TDAFSLLDALPISGTIKHQPPGRLSTGLRRAPDLHPSHCPGHSFGPDCPVHSGPPNAPGISQPPQPRARPSQSDYCPASAWTPRSPILLNRLLKRLTGSIRWHRPTNGISIVSTISAHEKGPGTQVPGPSIARRVRIRPAWP